MGKIIIHVDMDAFFAAVEVRDDPALVGKPLIIGALPNERGVVSTCSYEARVYGVRSGMSIKEAYRLCPNGIYLHPHMEKYRIASHQVHEIWDDYTDLVEYISLDEGYLDVTGSAHLNGGAAAIGMEIKRRTVEKTGLTCSVGVGYSIMSAKLASEEKKPDGYFEIPNAAALKELIIDRNVRIIWGVGLKTAEAFSDAGMSTVRDIYENRGKVIRIFGNHGKKILELADGIDDRPVTPYTEAKSIGKEHTFQEDITNFAYLKDSLLLVAKELSFDIRKKGIFASTVTLKITYGNMRQITRSKTCGKIQRAADIYAVAAALLDNIDRRSVRLVGISLSGLSDSPEQQLSLLDDVQSGQRERVDEVAFEIQKKYGKNAIKTGNELSAQQRLREDDDCE